MITALSLNSVNEMLALPLNKLNCFTYSELYRLNNTNNRRKFRYAFKGILSASVKFDATCTDCVAWLVEGTKERTIEQCSQPNKIAAAGYQGPEKIGLLKSASLLLNSALQRRKSKHWKQLSSKLKNIEENISFCIGINGESTG